MSKVPYTKQAKVELYATLSTLPISPNKTTKIITNKNWLQFLFLVKAAVLKQQISKFYPQILSTEDSFYIYDRPLTEINVIASFFALNLLTATCVVTMSQSLTGR